MSTTTFTNGVSLSDADWFNDVDAVVYEWLGDGTNEPSTRAAARNNLFTGGTVTTSTPVISATQTWNDGAVTFTGLKMNVTDTASAAASLLLDLQVGGTSKWKVDKTGAVTAVGAITAGGFNTTNGNVKAGGLSYNATTESNHAFVSNTSDVAGGTILRIISNVNGAVYGCDFFNVDIGGDGYNAAQAAMKLGKSGGTRSLNAAGTLNASGADYAEYEYKSSSCGTLLKGQIVGFDKNGQLTDKYSEAYSFAIKSTNPSYVGGDGWGVGLNESQIEQMRVKVDRIAYSGKVPVNVYGAEVGDYIVAGEEDNQIVGCIRSDLDFTEYKYAVGRVRRILPDGRAEVAVLIH